MQTQKTISPKFVMSERTHNLKITLNECPTMLINGKQFILTGEFLIIAMNDDSLVVLDEETDQQFLLSK